MNSRFAQLAPDSLRKAITAVILALGFNSTFSLSSVASSLGEFPNLTVSPIAEASENGMDQVTSVAQLSDIRPSDWAFQALQSLVERYGCIAGYPDKTFRGDRTLSRYEFAAGLNACLDSINELIAANTADLVKQEDLKTLEKLQAQFLSELAALRGRIDALEARTAKLEAQQFSTTTKMNGFVLVGVQRRTENRGDRNPRDGQRDTDDPGTNINVINQNYLYFTTQFSPRDFLYFGFWNQTGSGSPRLTNDGRVGYDGEAFDLYLSDLNFPDLFGKGNLGGLYVGQPPKITRSNLPAGNNVPDFLNTGLGRSGGQPGTTTHIEAFYRWQVNDNLSITPGVIWILQPGHTPDSDSFVTGIIRSTFAF